MSYTVYCHTNKLNGKKYIGITARKPEERWQNGRGYAKCTAFENAIQKYGWEEFLHEILFTDLTKKEAEAKEVELILKWDTRVPNGYNLDSGGSANRQLSIITKQKIGNANRGKVYSKEVYERAAKTRHDNGTSLMKPVYCINTGDFFKCIGDASKHTNVLACSISACCKGKRRYAGVSGDGEKIRWCYAENYDIEKLKPIPERNYSEMARKKMSEAHKGVKMSEQNKRALREAVCKKIKQIDITTGETLNVYESIREASDITKTSYTSIVEICKGNPRRKTAGGFIWKYADDYIEDKTNDTKKRNTNKTDDGTSRT